MLLNDSKGVRHITTRASVGLDEHYVTLYPYHETLSNDPFVD
jgi:hypothetical protein